MAVEFLPSGDCGLTVQFGYEIERDLATQIMALRAAIDDQQIAGIVETVPTYRSLLVHYDPLQTSQSALIEILQPLVASLRQSAPSTARHWTLPICMQAEHAPDLANVAQLAGLSEEEVVRQFLATTHFIYMLGFAPGLPYMGDLPLALNIPRHENPVPKVEKGSVLIATGLTIIFPTDNPTGWHVLGRTPVPIFDLAKQNPVLFSPGDQVSFQPVGLDDYRDIEQQLADGSYQIQCKEAQI